MMILNNVLFCIIHPALSLLLAFCLFLSLASHIHTHTPAEPLPFQSMPKGIPSDCIKYQKALFLHNGRNTYQDYALLLWYELQLNKTSPAAR